jgi:hypothetical protein
MLTCNFSLLKRDTILYALGIGEGGEPLDQKQLQYHNIYFTY